MVIDDRCRRQSREQHVLPFGHSSHDQLTDDERMDENSSVLIEKIPQGPEARSTGKEAPPYRRVDEHGLHERLRLTSRNFSSEP